MPAKPGSLLGPFLVLVTSLLLTSCGGEGGHGDGHGNHSSHGGHASSTSAPRTEHGDASSEAANELLDLLEVGGQHDASRFVEMEIGSFRVTHRLTDEQQTIMVKFRLFGIVPESKEERLHHELSKFEKRIRDAVISLVQKTEVEQLAEPGLKWLKAELVAAINRVVQDRALQGVAFSDFSMEEV